MKKGYNLYNLVEKFKKWLVAEKIELGENPPSKATLKNYASDLRHFFGWSTLKLKMEREELQIEELTPEEFISFIDTDLVQEYKKYLVSNKIPLKTVNRRLSTLRKFFSFCIDQSWITENPAKKVKNQKKTKQELAKEEEIINEFKSFLLNKKIPKEKVATILADIKEFLEFAHEKS